MPGEWSTGAGYCTSCLILDHCRQTLRIRPSHLISLNFAPGVEVLSLKQDDDELVAQVEQAGLLLGLYASRPVTKDLVCGQTAPIGGWASSGYGEKQPSLTLRASLVADAGRRYHFAPLQTSQGASLHPGAAAAVGEGRESPARTSIKGSRTSSFFH
jgi:hypothetical protein